MNKKLFWADLHNHNEIGYGKGSLDRSYAIAERALDVYAFTPHGYWPDCPSQDEKVKDYHQNGFSRVRKRWDQIVQKANTSYEPQRFVPFIGYEWHSSFYGDYCVYFPNNTGELYPAQNLPDLINRFSASDVLFIPHHGAYPRGYRGTDWQFVKPEYSPLAEIYSEHGCSFESFSHFGMYRHSMGGSCKSQTILENLRKGCKVGFTAGTDNHYGHPASYGEGLTGIYAAELTREAVFAALRNRNCYAVTGDRIEISTTLNDAIMGESVAYESATCPEGNIFVRARSEILLVELLKNGEHFQAFFTKPDGWSRAGPYLVRLEWGWDEMHSPFVTDWELNLTISDGTFFSFEPCFCSGPSISDRVNEAFGQSDSLLISSSSSRENLLPTQTLLLWIHADMGTELRLTGKITRNNETFELAFTKRMGELLKDDSYVFVNDLFSFPKLKIHVPLPEKSLELREAWSDPRAEPNDFYVLKVVQKNGHMAWASPIWIEE